LGFLADKWFGRRQIIGQGPASLTTAKVSDDVFAAPATAQVKLEPKPLTKDRDAVATFWQHHQIIVAGQSLRVSDVFKDSRLCPLLSTERPIDVAEVQHVAEWER
jgi:hypothetical protein